MADIIQLKITLKHIKPLIWRRVLVPWDFTFEQLHHVIQYAMGWEQSHLYLFDFNGFKLSSAPGGDDNYLAENDYEDAAKIRIGSVLKVEKQKFRYEYDFGDGWVHDIEVQKLLSADDKITYPACTGGANNCPPEDCGGPPGFAMFAAAMRDKKHLERKNLIAWLGGEYDPEEFDIDAVNERLETLSE